MRRREWACGYLLMSPTLLVMVAMLIVPMIALVIMSFWTQTVLEIDRTFTLDNYWHLIEPAGEGDEIPTFLGIPFPLKRAVYLVLLLKSILMSLSATVAVILLAYPMAYFLAFRVKRHKMIWLMAITLLLILFAWPLDARPAVSSGPAVRKQTMKEALAEAFRHPSYLLLKAGFFVCGFHIAFVTTHLPPYLGDLGFSGSLAAWSVALIGLFNVIGAYTAGVLGGR
ncbi:MAG: hypothetical protein ACREBP_07685, partial [Sphingomicrobium sp.]